MVTGKNAHEGETHAMHCTQQGLQENVRCRQKSTERRWTTNVQLFRKLRLWKIRRFLQANNENHRDVRTYRYVHGIVPKANGRITPRRW